MPEIKAAYSGPKGARLPTRNIVQADHRSSAGGRTRRHSSQHAKTVGKAVPAKQRLKPDIVPTAHGAIQKASSCVFRRIVATLAQVDRRSIMRKICADAVPGLDAPPPLVPSIILASPTQRAQYPLIKEYGLNSIGLHIMI